MALLTTADDEKDRMSSGAVAGIVIGVLLGVAVLGTLIVLGIIRYGAAGMSTRRYWKRHNAYTE